jgi:hypothetical protein
LRVSEGVLSTQIAMAGVSPVWPMIVSPAIKEIPLVSSRHSFGFSVISATLNDRKGNHGDYISASLDIRVLPWLEFFLYGR